MIPNHSCRLTNTLMYDSPIYNTALKGGDSSVAASLAATVSGSPGPVVIHCDSDSTAMPACESRGCRSRLRASLPPTTGGLVTPGSDGLTKLFPWGGVVGPRVETVVDCWCNGVDPFPAPRQPMKCTDADACLNGGFCT